MGEQNHLSCSLRSLMNLHQCNWNSWSAGVGMSDGTEKGRAAKPAVTAER